MTHRKKTSLPPVQPTARSPAGKLTSATVGALPIVNRVLRRMRLEEFLAAYLPREDGRTRVCVATGLLVLLKNLLISREPLYGVGEWAAAWAPDLLGLTPDQLRHLNDDRVGRCLEKLYDTDQSSLVLAVVAHAVREFQLALDELHNDGTTFSFYGAYATAAKERRQRGRTTPAITFGHSKEHRPDLKQLLYLLTVTSDGGVPIYFTTASGNVTDDTTHVRTWELLRELVGRPDFLYVGDSKLAVRETMRHIAGQGGRFLSILPRTRQEHREFHERLRQGNVLWKPLYEKRDREGRLYDCGTLADTPGVTAEGFRLVWLHSTLKAQRDAAARATRIERLLADLAQLQEKLASPKTRYRQQAKVDQAVEKILQKRQAERWMTVRVEEQSQERFRQTKRGRPGQNTQYLRQVRTRFSLQYEIDHLRLAEEQAGDGVFPLVTNDRQLTPLELLHAYKRQPLVEKRFSQIKTDYQVAPVYLKEVRRITALLCVYFLAQLVQALMERELRRAMEREKVPSLPMYPEGRACRRPTTRRLIDIFQPIQRHVLRPKGESPLTLVTELSPLHRQVLRLLDLQAKDYGR